LRLNSDFALVRRRGRLVQGSYLRVGGLKLSNEPALAKAGFVTSKKVGGAVTRNLIRRRLREIFRSHQSQIQPGWMLVISAKPAAASASFEDLREEWLLLARRLSIFHVSE
jgi:ribonuclease P protein component